MYITENVLQLKVFIHNFASFVQSSIFQKDVD